MKTIFLALILMCVTTACAETDPLDNKDYDRCVEASLTITCLKTAAGAAPNTTTYNDMDEVVDTCRFWARRLAHKPVSQIPLQCR